MIWQWRYEDVPRMSSSTNRESLEPQLSWDVAEEEVFESDPSNFGYDPSGVIGTLAPSESINGLHYSSTPSLYSEQDFGNVFVLKLKNYEQKCWTHTRSVEQSTLCDQKAMLASEYPAVVSGATVGNLEVPGAPVKSDSDWCRSSWVLAVVNSSAELLWIKRFIISVSAEIWTCSGSRFTLIL